jgi:hypothetical protein
VKTEVTTNITTVKDSDGDKKVIQTKEVEEVQTIQLKMQTQSFKQGYKSPVQVTATTKITENGVTKLISVDRSAYYD